MTDPTAPEPEPAATDAEETSEAAAGADATESDPGDGASER